MKLVLLDTTGREKWLFKPLMDLLETVGWQVDYRPIDQLMDIGPKRLNLTNYKAAFFIFGFEFLKGVGKSPVSAKIMTLMQQYCKLPSRLIGFIFPPLNAPANVNLIGSFAPIFNNIGITVQQGQLTFPNLDTPQAASATNATPQKNIDAFLYVANSFLSRPLETRPRAYHTTLSDPRPGLSFYSKEVDRILQSASIYLKPLPSCQQFSPIVKETFPYGLYWYNPIRNNHIFLAYSTIFSFSSISENFHFCPTDYVIRKEIHKAIQQMMWECTLLVKALDQEQNVGAAKIITIPDELALPWSIETLGSKLEADEQPAQTHKIAWMETSAFEDKPADKNASQEKIIQDKLLRNQQQDNLIDYIFTAELDTLWLSITPNIYFSPIARQKANTEIVLGALGNFTKKLSAVAQAKNKKVPRIFIGFEIANNLYAPNLPRQCSVDLYGNLYQDLPSSLDRTFWKNEIKKPLTDLLTHWKNPQISHGVPIAGVVLDLEMYCRKITGEFLSCMGFDQLSFARFTNYHRLSSKNMPVNEKANFLMSNKQTSQYFSFLEHDAESLGFELRSFFKQKIPHCIIACYMPSILINWFYKGLYKGLSEKKHPLQLYTFNSEFQGHKTWFEVNKLAVQHASVLLLSKIKTTQDYSWVNNILQHHHGIWLNRFSRMIEQKNNDWGAVERPLIDDKYYQSFCETIGKAS